MVSVLVVSEVRLYREGLAQALENDGRLSLAGTAAEGASALRAARREPLPDVVLLDISLPDALELGRSLSRQEPPVRVVALGLSGRARDAVRCAEAGVSGFLSRDQSLDDLVETVLCAARGELLCSERVAGALQRQVAKLAALQLPDPDAARLTLRELEVVELIDEGLSNKEIAVRLRIQLATAKNHVHNILEKLGVRSRAQAATLARRSGLLRWRSPATPSSHAGSRYAGDPKVARRLERC